MQLSTLLQALTFATATSAISVAYDKGYDQAGRSMNAVTCSDGENGLITKYGWKTQGAIPRFPHIGAAQAVTGWNSPGCGTCWELTYKGKKITVLAIDKADAGFNIGFKAMNELTGGNAAQLGRIDATQKKVPISRCGL